MSALSRRDEIARIIDSSAFIPAPARAPADFIAARRRAQASALHRADEILARMAQPTPDHARVARTLEQAVANLSERRIGVGCTHINAMRDAAKMLRGERA